jgi:CDP-paratose 2-epimerase
LKELPTRWEYAAPEDWDGIDESCGIDQTLHSLFGVSKAAADLLVQEYGRYFNMPTVCFRGGCLTGPNHSGAELHGFLAYMARCFREGRTYRIFGYKGKQVRDNIHSQDVCSAFHAFYENPRCAAVYNLGGGRQNSTSILEAISRMKGVFGRELKTQYIEQNRVGDHICYISDLRRFQADYPEWKIQVSLNEIFEQFAVSNAKDIGVTS